MEGGYEVTRERPLPWVAGRLPGPVRGLLGVVVALLGLWLVSRPVASLTVLTFYLGVTCLVAGIGELVGGTRWSQRLTGVLWVAVGTVALLAPGPASGALPAVVAVVLVVSGLFRVVRVRRERTLDGRLSALLLALAEVVLGVVTLAWPDITLVVVAVIFGVRAVVVGVQFVWDAAVGVRRTPEAPAVSRGPWRRTGRFVASALALVLAAGTWWATGAARDASPQVTDFYTPPADVPAEPGQLLRAEPFTAEVPDGARAWRILHTTTDHDGAPTTASGLVVVPEAPADDDRPVIAWAHGTTGQARQCAPSLLSEPFTAGAFPVVLDEVVDRGWAVVATDYVGLGAGGDHAYLVESVAGHAVLDSVRAARQLTEAELGDNTVVWGHSQGGASALWTAQVQPTYAPDVPLAGTVAMAPASDTVAIAEGLGEVTGGSVFAAFVVQGYAAAYEDVDVREVVEPAAVSLVERMTSRCLSEPGVLASVLTALSLGNSEVLRPDAARGPLGERLLENVPLEPGTSPLLVAQGADDVLITPALQRAYVRQIRVGGRDVEFSVHPGRDHLSLVQDEASPFLPELLDWTAARFG